MRPRRHRPSRRSAARARGGAGFWALIAVLVLLASYLALLELSRPDPEGRPLRVDEFVQLVESDRVRSARILDQDGIVTGRYETRAGSSAPYHVVYFQSEVLRERLADLLVAGRVPTSIDRQFAKTLIAPLSFLIPTLILVVVLAYLVFSYRRESGLFAVRSGSRRITAEDSPVTFADVAAQDAAVAELREVSQFLADPERFAALGARVPKGILLYGPPGSGKTLLARALAGEAGAAFFSISGSDFVELYVGVGAARVRELFREAREHAPAIVFIDELDSVGRRRATGGAAATGSAEEQEQAINQILAEMDGFSPQEGIIVLAATNRPDVLDPALLRPGRFDRSIGLERPDEGGRLAILERHAAGKSLARGVDLAAVARDAVGMTGADLASVMNEAALLAARAGRAEISRAELDSAVARVREAPERRRRLAMRDRPPGGRVLSDERVTFADVAGLDEAIAELQDVREYLAEPERFVEMGARVPRGYLLVGPPGCGKTLLARAVAGEANAAFFSVAASEFVEALVGEGAARVRDLFAEARALAPAIVFIDEIDAIGGRRGVGGGHHEYEQTLNQILVELDGFGSRAGVIVIAATNRPELLDPALVRPGRFDRTVAIDPPDQRGRRAILELHARGKPLAGDADLGVLAGLTRGMAGADLAGVMNEAALLAARRRLPAITMALLEEAVERTGLGTARTRVLSDEERRTVAYHEAGHAIAALALPGAEMPHKLSVLPRGRSLGAMWHLDGHDRLLHSRSTLLDRMAMLLGGRVAEELVFGEPSSGASNDLARVAEMARAMVAELGMGETLAGLSPGAAPERWSSETARAVEAEAGRLVEEAHERARAVLSGRRELLDRVAAALLERETLSASDLEAILAGGPQVARPISPGPHPGGGADRLSGAR